MSISVLLNGAVYTIPQTGEESWGENLTTYFVAIPQGVLQKSGGTFTLTADVNFGANYGLLSKYFSTRTALPSTAGLLRMAVSDSIGWRNNANNANLLLAVNGSNQLTFNGSIILAGITIGALDSASAVAAGLALTSTVLSAQSATTSFPGLVNNTTQSFSGGKSIIGNADVVQLTVKGNSAQTAVVFRVQNSSATNLFSTDNSGLSTFVNLVSSTALPATSGALRIAVTDSIGWRNNANSGNLLLAVNGSDQLTFNGSVILAGITIGAFDSQVANATGLALTGTVLSTQSADATHPGMVNLTTQSFSGGKTILGNADVAQLTVKGNASQTSVVFRVLNSSSSTLLSTDNNGLSTFVNLVSSTANPAASGALRLAVTDTMGWRNNANNGNLLLAINGSDQLTFNGSVVLAGISIGAIDSQAANATGLALTGSVLSTQSADATHPGMVNLTTQSFSGGKSIIGNADVPQLTVKGNATQTSVVLRVQNSASSTLFSTDNNGLSTYVNLVSSTSNASSAGSLRLAVTDTIGWRNNANSGNLLLAVNGSNQLTFNGTAIQSTLTIGALDAQSANATGLALVANVLSTQSADSTHPGLINLTTQSVSGKKTFLGGLDANSTIITSVANPSALTDAANKRYALAAGAQFTFQPGGTASGNTFITWSALYTAMTLVGGLRELTFDGSLGALTIPSGSYNLGNVMFRPLPGVAGTTVTCASGCVFTDFPSLTGDITLSSTSSAPIYTVPAMAAVTIYLYNGSQFVTSGFAAIVSVPSSSVLIVQLFGGSILLGTTGQPVISGDAGSQISIVLYDNSRVSGNTIAMAVTGTLEIDPFSQSAEIFLPQTDCLGTLDVTSNAISLYGSTGRALMIAADSATDTYSIYYPASQGAAYSVLKNDGAGALTWVVLSSILSIGTLDSASPSANGAVLSGTSQFQLVLQSASATAPGLVNTSTQTFAGVKTFNSSPVMNSLVGTQAVVTDGGKALASLAFVSAATALTLPLRDSNANTRMNSLISNFQTVASAATTTTLLVDSPYFTQVTGSTTQIVALPSASTLVRGQAFMVTNRSSGAVTVNDGGGSLVQSMAGSSQAIFTVTNIGSTAGSWDSAYTNVGTGAAAGTVTSVALTVPTALFATSPVTGSPVTTSGTLAPTLATQTARTFFQGPSSGSAATPTFAALTAPTVQNFIAAPSGATNYSFVITSGNATVGATYTNNAQTFTVLATVASAILVFMSGTGTPATSGTLTKATGSGDATLTFSAFNGAYVRPTTAPLYIRVRMVGAGGGGGSSNTTGGSSGGNGSATAFGTSLLSCGGGSGGPAGNTGPGAGGGGGNAVINSPAIGTGVSGGSGGGGSYTGNVVAGLQAQLSGGNGGNSGFGGGGGGGFNTGDGLPGISNSGGGGGGAGVVFVNSSTGAGGGAGGFIDALIPTPSALYLTTIGISGTAGVTSGTGHDGGLGGSGYIEVTEYYQ